MNRADCVQDPAVCDFVDWFSPLLIGDRLLKHSFAGALTHTRFTISVVHDRIRATRRRCRQLTL